MNLVKEVCNVMEQFAPISYQESYDNCGLLIGDYNTQIKGVLICLDVTEEIIEEAIALNCNMVVAHHPLIFSGLKKITGNNYVERIVIKAIKNNIAVYAAHTNADNLINGVNSIIANKIGLINCTILSPKKNALKKLVTFCPTDKAPIIQNALFKVGAGKIGNYDESSFTVQGEGTFKANNIAKPYVGKANIRHSENETRIEVIFESYNEANVIEALISSHPYEEVAYYITALENYNNYVGVGLIGYLEKEEDEIEFLTRLKRTFNSKSIQYSPLLNKKIKKIALCGGSGSFLVTAAIKKGADILITSDIKYHSFFDAENKIILADIGHYESEQYTMELFYKLISKNFSTFAVHLTKINTNPINYI